MTRALQRTSAAENLAFRNAVWVGGGILVGLGLFWAESLGEILAYLMVLAASLIPTTIWIRQGRVGVPILPAIATLHIVYYALPIVRGRDDLIEYSYADILRAAATVSLFLLVAAFAAYLVLRGTPTQGIVRPGLLSDSQMVTLVLLGLGLGNLYLAAAAADWLWILGGFFGLVRSIALTALLVAAYFLGVARGRRVLRRGAWVLAAAALGSAVIVSWGSLYLVGGLMFLLAAGVGYVTTRGRIPWVVATVLLVLISILHAGKEEMRHRYWRQEGGAVETGLLQLPSLALEWFEAGIESLGPSKGGRSALDRASLLQILLKVQYLTPSYIDYAQGETYSLLPRMLVPRFLSPNKIKSKAGMDLLNVRYGIQTVEATESTAIGWGLIAEGYANFGFIGVGAIALLVGFVSGAMTRKSALSSTVSVSTLVAVAVMVGLINLEQDLAALVTSTLQSTAAVFVFVAILRLFPKRRRVALTGIASTTPGRPLQPPPPASSGPLSV